MMQCPNCKAPLERKRFKGRETEVDRCAKCEGVWFDDGEIAALVGAVAASSFAIPPNAVPKPAMPCPKCITPLSLFTYPGTMTIVEGCRTCRGIWLERGELQEIAKSRSARMTCPSCGHAQPAAESCAQCGIVISKFVRPTGDARAERARRVVTRPAPPQIPGVKGSLIRFVDSTLQALWQAIRN